MAPSRIPLSLGTMTFAYKGGRISDTAQVQKIIDTFRSHGHNMLDTARTYGEGTTEELLSDLKTDQCVIDSKCYPVNPGDHQPEKLRASLLKSLETLKVKKLRIFYLHAPDRATPFQDTLGEVQKLYQQGLFEELGLSNYAAWEVALVWSICDKNKWVKPTVYQGMYNAITRAAEPELIPCCRKLGLRLMVYNPLAGGILAKLPDPNQESEKGARFDKDTRQGKMYRERYWKDSLFQALKHLRSELGDITPTAAALRWMQHHSKLDKNDGIIIGGSSLQQIEDNCKDSEGGPLPDNILKAIDEAEKIFRAECPPYWR